MFPRVIMNGTMIKKSQQKRKTSPGNYKERLFVLDTKELTYSEQKHGKEPVVKGTIPLSAIKCAEIVYTDLKIPCKNKFPFQIFYERNYLYIFAPDNECRQQWVTALKEETQNNDLVAKYHPNMWTEGKWRCCQQTNKLAMGCVLYDTGILAFKKVPPPASNQEVKQYDPDVRTVRAIQDFVPKEEGNLQIHKNQEYILIDDSDFDWWKVQDSEGNNGTVPSTYVAGQFETNFERFEWFNNNITSENAVNLLAQVGKEGAFMVRKSSKPGLFTVSVFTKEPGGKEGRNPNVRHYLIHQKQDSETPFFASEKSFSTIPELIYYHQHDAGGMVTRLRHPVSRDRRFSINSQDHSEYQWQLNPLELTLNETLGSGQFGVVMGGQWRDKKVAVKMIKEGSMSEEDFKEEAKVMMKLSHSKLVQLYGVCTQRSPMCMVCEFMEKGALLDYLKAERGNLSKTKLLDMCLDVCEGMNYLESSNFIHRDLAARNCLVSQDGNVKVADFGMARLILDNEYTSSHGTKFPIRWSAPEVIRYGKYSSKSDVWSFGVLMWEVYTEGHLPYETQNNMQVVNLVNSGQRLQKPPLATKDVYVLMKWCWKEKPDDRPGFGQLLHQLASLSDL